MDTKDAILAFMAAINDHDVDRIVALASADHRFIDAHGGEVGFDA